MHSEWIEFKAINCNSDIAKKVVKYYDIVSVERINDETCSISLEAADGIHFFKVAECFDEVMDKLKAFENQAYVVVNDDKKEDE